MRKQVTFRINDIFSFTQKLMLFSERSSRSCILSSNEFNGTENEIIAGIDCVQEINAAQNSFDALKKFYEEEKDWLFGFLSYDLKNEIETLPLTSLSRGRGEGGEVGFPLLHFFQPKYVFIIKEDKLEIHFLPEVFW